MLSDDEIAELAKSGAEPSIAETDAGLLLTMDAIEAPLTDSLTADGRQAVTGPIANQPGDVELFVNFATSAAGSIRCEIQDAQGKPLPGFTLADSDERYGDSLDRVMSWNGRRELKSLVGRPIRLRFLLKDAHLYALRFGR